MWVYQRVIIMFRIKIATTGVDPEPPIFINRTQSSKTYLLMAFGIIRFARKDRESCGMKRPQKCLPSGQQKHTKTHGIPRLWMASHKKNNHCQLDHHQRFGQKTHLLKKVQNQGWPSHSLLLQLRISHFGFDDLDDVFNVHPGCVCFWGVDRVGFNPMSQRIESSWELSPTKPEG